jgi:anti-anti-sigma regulatory factor
MGQVRVVDRASKEIVVFLAGDIDGGMEEQLSQALSEVVLLERLDDLDRVVVDAREVTSLGPAGIRFLRNLERTGEEQGFDLAFSMLNGPALAALSEEQWPYAAGSGIPS